MQELENTQANTLLSSEELRQKAFSKSHQRGQAVAGRRIV